MLKSVAKNVARRLSTDTVDGDEIRHFMKFTDQWWNKFGSLKPLHSMNQLRVPFIRDGLINSGAVDVKNSEVHPLKNIKLLDVGCGGGILTEPLVRLGATVTGLDANNSAVEVAQWHAAKQNMKVTYICESIDKHSEEHPEIYDTIVASEIIEHVTQKSDFVKACVKCLKPGGSIFITTINKTPLANLATIVIAEGIGLVPKGTHEYEKLIEPHKLQRFLDDVNCRTVMTHGMAYNFLTDSWSWTPCHTINYALHAVKIKEA